MQRLRQLLFLPTIGRHCSENPRSRWKSTGVQIAGQSWQTLWRRVLSFLGGPSLLTNKHEEMLRVNSRKTLKQEATGDGEIDKCYLTSLAQHLWILGRAQGSKFSSLFASRSPSFSFASNWIPASSSSPKSKYPMLLHYNKDTICQRKRRIFQSCKRLIMSLKSIITPKFGWGISSISIRAPSDVSFRTTAIL